jgi:hypothetical protein
VGFVVGEEALDEGDGLVVAGGDPEVSSMTNTWETLVISTSRASGGRASVSTP